MNRRHFCKIATLAAGAIGLGEPLAAEPKSSAKAALSGHQVMPSPGCSICIVRRECNTDLQSLFLDDPDTGPCEAFSSGDSFTFAAGTPCPDDFCPKLWTSICNAVSNGSCAPTFKPSTQIVSCPDGTRPVLVRIDFT